MTECVRNAIKIVFNPNSSANEDSEIKLFLKSVS